MKDPYYSRGTLFKVIRYLFTYHTIKFYDHLHSNLQCYTSFNTHCQILKKGSIFKRARHTKISFKIFWKIKADSKIRYCDAKFPTYRKIKKHNLDKHSPTKCEHCDKVYSCKAAYYSHKLTVHVDKSVKNFKCENCDYATHAKKWLNEHKR